MEHQTEHDEEKSDSDKNALRSIAAADGEDDEEIEPVNDDYKPTYHTFQIKREEKFSITGNTFTYTLTHNKKLIMSSKSKGRYPSDPMPINHGSEVHLSHAGEYSFIPGKDATTFELRKESKKGKLLMKSQIIHSLSDKTSPRSVVATLNIDSSSIDIVTKKPKKNSNGYYILNFHGRKTLPSEKNAIFVLKGQENTPEVLSIRKIAINKIEIIIDSKINHATVFALGLTSFVGNFNA